jgi:NitT/TauT family transport system ATP-binding protein
MQALLTELVHRHASAALLVTHDIDDALRVSDRVLLMGGRPSGIVGEWGLLDALGPAPRERPIRFDAPRRRPTADSDSTAPAAASATWVRAR